MTTPLDLLSSWSFSVKACGISRPEDAVSPPHSPVRASLTSLLLQASELSRGLMGKERRLRKGQSRESGLGLQGLTESLGLP